MTNSTHLWRPTENHVIRWKRPMFLLQLSSRCGASVHFFFSATFCPIPHLCTPSTKPSHCPEYKRERKAQSTQPINTVFSINYEGVELCLQSPLVPHYSEGSGTDMT